MAPRKPTITGEFEIVETELWDKEDLDLMGKAYVRLAPDGTGDIRFIAVRGSLDHRSTTRDEKPAVEFSWEGFDECDPVFGRGWAVLDTGDILRGMFFFHMGDESRFVARRVR